MKNTKKNLLLKNIKITTSNICIRMEDQINKTRYTTTNKKRRKILD